MAETAFYALWLMPSSELYDHLARVIFNLSREHRSPSFEPHVTLLANITGSEDVVSANCRRLAALVESYPIRLTKLDYLSEYYRCVFVRVLETVPVIEANSRARGVFGLQQGPPYMPHLSLLYGSFDRTTKQQIIESLGKSWGLEFTVDRFYLIDGRGGPTDWRKVAEFVFEKPQATR